MIFDSHMHVGSFESMFGVSLDRDGIDELMRENEISNGVVFYPDNGSTSPVLLHCGHPIFTLPWSIEELAVSFPAAKIIIGHMGHGNVVYINGSIEVALRNPNVYLETSGMPMHTKIREAYERVGETRVLFGTDVPFHHPVVEIAKVRVSGLAPEAVDRVLSKNGRLLFFGDENATEPVAV
jgi:predicted TIM-barrel fold metal-dependent hydrolase